MIKKWLSLFSSFSLLLPLAGQTIAEKRATIENGGLYLDLNVSNDLKEVNQALSDLKAELKSLYEEALLLYQNQAEVERLHGHLEKVKQVKSQIQEVEHLWRQEVVSTQEEEQYGLFHAQGTLLSEFIMDYGASNYLYIIPEEMQNLHLHISSNIPIPKESWEECLECILSQYGIAIRSITPYIKELYFGNGNFSGLQAITDSIEELSLMPPKARVCFIMSEEEHDPRSSLLFLNKFSNPQNTLVDLFGGRIFIVSHADAIQELLKLYSFVKNKTGKQELQLISLEKLPASEMSTILQLAFDEGALYPTNDSNLRIISLDSLPHSLVLAGNKEEIKRAKQMVEEIESNLQNPDETTLFWYTTKHSDAEELAEVVSKVYDLLIQSPSALNTDKINAKIFEVTQARAKEEKATGVVHPAKVAPGTKEQRTKSNHSHHNHFIVDPKTGSILMVVRQDALPRIKQLLKKLDVPKKMVQIEVLLFEKKMDNHSKHGLNLLRLGSQAVNTVATGGLYHSGILEFFMSRSKNSGMPAYDLAYNFLLGQDDVQINASPSVTTMNQTPATIAIVEEISIDAGNDDKKNRIYNRAQYGITLEITPTINIDSEEGEAAFITLDTDITFDTTKKNQENRPDVTRRHIKNLVRIKDGETLILGGLRRKSQEDKCESIPFLGEIPGIGKLFSSTEISDSSTEMFVFITPKILSDPIESQQQANLAALSKRAGDLPEFLQELDIAKDKQKRKLFERSISALFGRQEAQNKPRTSRGEYDGRG